MVRRARLGKVYAGTARVFISGRTSKEVRGRVRKIDRMAKTSVTHRGAVKRLR